MLVAAGTPAEIVATVRDHFPAVLGVRAARLVLAGDSPFAAAESGPSLDRAALAALTRGDKFALGPVDAGPRRIGDGLLDPLPESAAHVALPAVLPGEKPPGVLALAGTDKDSFREDDATDLLAFLAGLTAVALIARGGGG